MLLAGSATGSRSRAVPKRKSAGSLGLDTSAGSCGHAQSAGALATSGGVAPSSPRWLRGGGGGGDGVLKSSSAPALQEEADVLSMSTPRGGPGDNGDGRRPARHVGGKRTLPRPRSPGLPATVAATSSETCEDLDWSHQDVIRQQIPGQQTSVENDHSLASDGAYTNPSPKWLLEISDRMVAQTQKCLLVHEQLKQLLLARTGPGAVAGGHDASALATMGAAVDNVLRYEGVAMLTAQRVTLQSEVAAAAMEADALRGELVEIRLSSDRFRAALHAARKVELKRLAMEARDLEAEIGERVSMLRGHRVGEIKSSAPMERPQPSGGNGGRHFGNNCASWVVDNSGKSVGAITGARTHGWSSAAGGQLFEGVQASERMLSQAHRNASSKHQAATQMRDVAATALTEQVEMRSSRASSRRDMNGHSREGLHKSKQRSGGAISVQSRHSSSADSSPVRGTMKVTGTAPSPLRRAAAVHAGAAVAAAAVAASGQSGPTQSQPQQPQRQNARPQPSQQLPQQPPKGLTQQELIQNQAWRGPASPASESSAHAPTAPQQRILGSGSSSSSATPRRGIAAGTVAATAEQRRSCATTGMVQPAGHNSKIHTSTPCGPHRAVARGQATSSSPPRTIGSVIPARGVSVASSAHESAPSLSTPPSRRMQRAGTYSSSPRSRNGSGSNSPLRPHSTEAVSRAGSPPRSATDQAAAAVVASNTPTRWRSNSPQLRMQGALRARVPVLGSPKPFTALATPVSMTMAPAAVAAPWPVPLRNASGPSAVASYTGGCAPGLTTSPALVAAASMAAAAHKGSSPSTALESLQRLEMVQCQAQAEFYGMP